MDRRVTPPKRVSSPTWGPPHPRKLGLRSDAETATRTSKKIIRFKKRKKTFARASRFFVNFVSLFARLRLENA